VVLGVLGCCAALPARVFERDRAGPAQGLPNATSFSSQTVVLCPLGHKHSQLAWPKSGRASLEAASSTAVAPAILSSGAFFNTRGPPPSSFKMQSSSHEELLSFAEASLRACQGRVGCGSSDWVDSSLSLPAPCVQDATPQQQPQRCKRHRELFPSTEVSASHGETEDEGGGCSDSGSCSEGSSSDDLTDEDVCVAAMGALVAIRVMNNRALFTTLCTATLVVAHVVAARTRRAR
jgi:hypothetical protein